MTDKHDQTIEIGVYSPGDFAAQFGASTEGFISNKKRNDNVGDLFVALTDNGKLSGLAIVEKSPYCNNFYVAFVEVDKDSQGQGHSKRLLEHIFEMAAQKETDLLLSRYTKQGAERLSQTIDYLKTQYPSVYVAHEQY